MIIACSALVAERYGERTRAIAPGAELAVPVHLGWPERAQDAEAAYFSQDFWLREEDRPGGRLFALTKLRWLHSFSAGVDHPALRSLLLRRGTGFNLSG